VASQDNKSAGSSIWPWALATGLAVGFIIGREVGSRPGSPGAEPGAPAAVAAPAPPAAAGAGAGIPARVYAAEAEFPSGWMRSAELVGVAGLSMDGMSDAQKTAVMQALNERTCECGCTKGSFAVCVKTDAACPRSPKVVKQAVEMAKQGSSLTDILAYVDRENPKKGSAPSPAAAAPGPGSKKVSIPAHSPRKGPKNAKVTIVEFSDFQCPFCSRVGPTLAEIHQKYPNDVAVVFVNQPLSFHAQARPAAKAFLAAHKQGKGWEMHDKLFANQQGLTPENFDMWAKELGLDTGKFTKDMTDPATDKAVADDQALANSVGATGTPTFFINGRQLTGAKPFDDFKHVIDEEIVKADELLEKGTKPEKLYDTLMEMAANAPKPKIEVGSAPTKGPKSAPVTVVVFSDFQCPFCSRAVPLLKQIEDAYKDDVRIAFKHLPLAFHNNARLAAEASMAANEQGKFWEMHDKLFENQQALDRPSLEKYAQELGLDVAKFKAALDSGKYKQHVDDDAKMAAGVGATGTPTFYVNGEQLVGAKPFDDFKVKIDAALAAKK